LPKSQAAWTSLWGLNRARLVTAVMVLAIGALPHPFTGLVSDRFGRARPISVLMLLSAACSFAIGWGLAWPFPALVALGLLLFFDRFWWLNVAVNRVFELFGIGM